MKPKRIDGPDGLPRLALAAALAACAVAALAQGAAAPADHGEAAGRRIYVEGVLPDGAPLVGTWAGNAPVEGTRAACATCHRHSGMGSVEGDILVPPVTGQALYAGQRLRERVVAPMDPRFGRLWNQSHAPYTDQSLMAAIRDGTHVSGRVLSTAMPRYKISESDLSALTAYLKQLSAQWSPGVSADEVRFATVITPGADARRRQAFLDTLHGAIEQKNANTLPGHRHMINAAEMVMRSERRWVLDVWELQGAPEFWGAQLQARYQAAPVFAIVSGLGESTWEPVHDFCQREQVPCWFPSVPLPPQRAQGDFYALYFSRGIELEAAALVRHLAAGGHRPARIVQLLRDEPAARAAAQVLRREAGTAGFAVEDRLIAEGSADPLRAALAVVKPGDVVMLWLRRADLELLGGVAAPAVPVYLSAELIGGEHAPVAAPWKKAVRLVYPYELPDKRAPNLAYFNSWLKVRGLVLVDEPMQSEVFFAVNYLTDTMSEMLDNIYRDYLIERAENMLSRRESRKAADETIARTQAHPPAPEVAQASKQAPGAIFGDRLQGNVHAGSIGTPAFGERQGTTIYPRLSLAPGQRFASKGAYIARYGQADSDALVAESEWIVP
jgi:hypothetical protein